VLGTITDCEATETGWRGICEDGSVVNAHGHRSLRPPKIPEENRALEIRDGKVVGILSFGRIRNCRPASPPRRAPVERTKHAVGFGRFPTRQRTDPHSLEHGRDTDGRQDLHA
jgi:hypothetical protein